MMEIKSNQVASASRKILPDCTFECQFEAMLPVFRITLIGAIQVSANISSVARFILRCISLQVSTVPEISEKLGLGLPDVVRGTAELRESRLIEPQQADSLANTKFVISDEGKRYLQDNVPLFKLRKRSLHVDYDPLVNEYRSSEVDIVTVDEVRKNGDFVEPVRKKKPSLSDMRVGELRKLFHDDGQLREDADLVSIVKMELPFVRYRPVDIAVLRQHQGGDLRVLAFKGQRYLESESIELQRLLESGKTVIQPGIGLRNEVIPNLPVTAPDEKQRIERIVQLDDELLDIENDVDNFRYEVVDHNLVPKQRDPRIIREIERITKERDSLKQQLDKILLSAVNTSHLIDFVVCWRHEGK